MKEHMKLQLKPYLDVRRVEGTLRVGTMPGTGVEIEDAPGFLDDIVREFSVPVAVEEAAAVVGRVTGLDEEAAADILGQLMDARIIGPEIATGSRYDRHSLYFDMVDPPVEDAQRRLAECKVGIVGTGGIGSNVAMLLAAAGVGALVLSDGDVVEVSNLTRQFLYSEGSVGQTKVDVAQQRLGQLNSSVKVASIASPAVKTIFDDHFADCDVVVLSADSPDEIHEWIDDAARRHGFAYLAAGYQEAYGTVGPLVVPGATACYRCFEDTDRAADGSTGHGLSANLNAGMQAGSYGPLNSIVASMAANEVIRLLIGLECASSGSRLLLDSQLYDLHTQHYYAKRPDCLARVVRSNAALGIEAMVQEHERDGRAWKTERLIVPEACLLAGAALALCCRLDRARRRHGGQVSAWAVNRH